MTDEDKKSVDKTGKKTDVKKKDSSEKSTVIYCGPTIKGIVQQYAHFNNGIPAKLQEYGADHKAVERLIVPIESLVETKRNLSIKGTIENLSYIAIQKGE